MPPTAPQLSQLYTELNAEYFENRLPPCEIKWSRRLTRAAGTISVQKRLITLSVPLLVDAYQTTSLFPPEYEICGVKCADASSALREILKHEMIHLWLYVLGQPYGHTNAFRQKARAIGQPGTRHGIALPEPKTGWIYTCATCGREYPRRRRYGKVVACGFCCKTRAGGKFDPRFKLRGRRVV